MANETIIRLISGMLLLMANAFFVATEFALTRLRQYPDAELKGERLLQRAWKMTERLEIYLTSCQIGITTTSIVLGVVAEPAVTLLINSLIPVETIGGFTSHTISIVLSVVLINFIHTVWGEQAPTYLGVERAREVARYCALPLYWWTYAIYPLLYLGDWITKATLKLFGIKMKRSWTNETGASEENVKSQIVDLLKSEGLPEDRRDEVVGALEIDEMTVSDILIPKKEIICLYCEKSLGENLEIIKKQIRSRYPLVGASLDEYIGILYSEEILANIDELQQGSITLKDLSRSDLTVPLDTPVSRLIDIFQHEQEELALVTKGEKAIGLVTLTDAVEAIVGSAEDPMDRDYR